MDKIMVTIYFVGIAAVVNVPPHNNVTKAVIFPAAARTVTYKDIPLAPHHTWIHVTGLEDPKEECDKLSGTLTKAGVCTAQLSGAHVWILPIDPLTEDAAARKIPSFQKFCPAAKDLPSWYTDSPDPAYVAARFDIKGGQMSACNRNDMAFVMKMDAITTDGMLYIQQDERTVRLPLKDGAIIAIENRTDHTHASEFAGKDHFGWYYMMNGRVQQEYDINVPYAPVAGVVRCLTIPGADDGGLESITSADCSVTNFP
ncbi:MAG TPA: hypothetical protein VKB93_24750 [Thermoanaerobaculia bacterium]|nr:hypothetical protein [Thermoanaerobaculia bacterium]